MVDNDTLARFGRTPRQVIEAILERVFSEASTAETGFWPAEATVEARILLIRALGMTRPEYPDALVAMETFEEVTDETDISCAALDASSAFAVLAQEYENRACERDDAEAARHAAEERAIYRRNVI